MIHLDLFSGIGGFALATEMVWPNVEHVFCEKDLFCQAVLAKHWPKSLIYVDIKTLQEPPPAYIVTGGFPCQPFSVAGKRRGTEDDRHLWPEMLRIVRLSHPEWVIGENVSGLLTWDRGMVLDQVCTDLENEGYEVWPLVIPACAVGAPHRRDRVWILAHRNSERLKGGGTQSHKERSRGDETFYSRSAASYASSGGRREGSPHARRPPERKTTKTALWRRLTNSTGNSWRAEDWPTVAARLCALDDGVPRGLARPRGWRNAALKGAGNAIVPQVAAQIMFAIKSIENSK